MDDILAYQESAGLTASIQAPTFSNPSDLEKAGLISGYGTKASSLQLLSDSDFNLIEGGRGSTLSATDGADLFRLTSPGAVIQGFTPGQDILQITSSEELYNSLGIVPSVNPFTFADLVNPAQPGLIDFAEPGNTTDTLVTLPTGGFTTTPFVTLEGVTPDQLQNSPESFSFRSDEPNVIADWNNFILEVGRANSLFPVRAERIWTTVHTSQFDAIQGILQTPGRVQYLASADPNFSSLPSALEGASAEAAADAAAYTALRSIYTSPDFITLPSNIYGQTSREGVQDYLGKVIDAQFADSLRQIDDTPENIANGLSYGNAIANRILEIRANDGAFRDAEGNLVDPTIYNDVYQNGIEANIAINEKGPNPGQGNDGTVGRTVLNPLAYFLNQVPANTVSEDGVFTTSIAKTTAGAFRRNEDTFNAFTGQFNILAAPEWANLEFGWVIPSTNFFNDNVIPPPALDTARYRIATQEDIAEGSILDIPLNNAPGIKSDFVVLDPAGLPSGTSQGIGATYTVDGVTGAVPNGVIGRVISDSDPTDSLYGDFGALSRGGDGVGTTSAERTIISHAWANDEGSYQPPATWNTITGEIVRGKELNLADSAYTFAVLNLALADTFVNVWNIKWNEDYHWRPVSGIRNADQVDNTVDLTDPYWTPRQVTPQHPSYPSGTSTTAGTALSLIHI